MSGYEHHRGKLVKIASGNNACIEQAEKILQEKKKKQDTFYDNALDQICDDYYKEYFYHPKSESLYKVQDTQVDPYDGIIHAIKHDDVISYELRYHNGGTCFSECLEEALDDL